MGGKQTLYITTANLYKFAYVGLFSRAGHSGANGLILKQIMAACLEMRLASMKRSGKRLLVNDMERINQSYEL